MVVCVGTAIKDELYLLKAQVEVIQIVNGVTADSQVRVVIILLLEFEGEVIGAAGLQVQLGNATRQVVSEGREEGQLRRPAETLDFFVDQMP